MSYKRLSDLGLTVGVSRSEDGNMSVNWGKKEEVLENRKRFAVKLGIEIEDCVIASLSGGTNIEVVGKEQKGVMVECDALITTDAGIGLWMVTADCLPVVIYEPDKKIVALVHAGWRGVDGKITFKTVKKMIELGGDPDRMLGWIGPGVKEETYLKYGEKLDFFLDQIKENRDEWGQYLVKKEREGWYGIDLLGYTIRQLKDVGVKDENIQTSPVDTIKDKSYFSHYRAGANGEKEGRFATVVMRRKND